MNNCIVIVAAIAHPNWRARKTLFTISLVVSRSKSTFYVKPFGTNEVKIKTKFKSFLLFLQFLLQHFLKLNHISVQLMRFSLLNLNLHSPMYFHLLLAACFNCTQSFNRCWSSSSAVKHWSSIFSWKFIPNTHIKKHLFLEEKKEKDYWEKAIGNSILLMKRERNYDELFPLWLVVVVKMELHNEVIEINLREQ